MDIFYFLQVSYNKLLLDLFNFSPKLIKIIFILIILAIFYLFSTKLIKRILLKKTLTKRQKTNVNTFLHILRYIFFAIIILVIISISTDSLTGLGISAGLLTAALGWALQRPITGVVAWIMIIIKKPFQVGDRIIVGNIKGDVVDITLTHIYLNESGGTTKGDDISGRIIMIPNAKFFEQDIINSTLQDDYILDEILITITYKSNIDKAKEVCIKVAKKILKDPSREPFIRMSLKDFGIELRVKYYVIASKKEQASSEILEKIIKQIAKQKNVNIASIIQ